MKLPRLKESAGHVASRLPKLQQENDLSSHWSCLNLVKQEEEKEDTRASTGRNKRHMRNENTETKSSNTGAKPRLIKKGLIMGTQKEKDTENSGRAGR